MVTPVFSYTSTAEAAGPLGAKTVYVEIDPGSYNMDPATSEALITPRTKAIIPVSLYGQAAHREAINAIAYRNWNPAIEDGAEGFGAFWRGRETGDLTTTGCTRFFPPKPLGCCGDVGAILNSDQ